MKRKYKMPYFQENSAFHFPEMSKILSIAGHPVYFYLKIVESYVVKCYHCFEANKFHLTTDAVVTNRGIGFNYRSPLRHIPGLKVKNISSVKI